MDSRYGVFFSCSIFFISIGAVANEKSSVCYGETKNGRIEGAVQLPYSGKNFEGYSFSLQTLGRTYVHTVVRDIIVNSYQELEGSRPDKLFKYAESGLKRGGKFRPHKTHQNGLSVDFMVPVIDSDGNSAQLPTNLLNKWGYNIEFDGRGRFGEFTIDYEAMGAHIVSLRERAIERKVEIWRVIFDPALQPFLLNTTHGPYIRNNIELSKKKSWVRHDEHYHVDFKVPCQAM